jgi:hypothetical protein
MPLWLITILVLSVCAARPSPAAAQGHVHHAAGDAPADPLLRLVLTGPHLALAHDGYMALTEKQVAELQVAEKAVCAAEIEYVRRKARARTDIAIMLAADADAATMRSALEQHAAAESDWILQLMQARRSTRGLLSDAQRRQFDWLEEHWAREAADMISDATRAGQRGHPGTQLPIRVPGMVVAETVLAPYCEALHGPALHIVIPPVR